MKSQLRRFCNCLLHQFPKMHKPTFFHLYKNRTESQQLVSILLPFNGVWIATVLFAW